MEDKLELIKKAIPELTEEYNEINKLFDEAFSRIFLMTNTEFDGKYCNMATGVMQTIGYLLDVLK